MTKIKAVHAGELRDNAASLSFALGVLLARNMPSLHTLDVRGCGLTDDTGLSYLLSGLVANTHLRELDCRSNRPSVEFKRDFLTPALTALAAR